MTLFYVATMARYALVEAANEHEARDAGPGALKAACPDLRDRPDAHLVIRTVRPATSDEIEFWHQHNAALAREQSILAR